MDVRFAVFFSFLCIELIPHSPDGLDQFAFIAQLAAQLFYMRVNLSLIHICDFMLYPFMTLNDNTEIVHSEMKPDGRVKVYIETPDAKYCFRHATCWLPEYKWEDVYQYSDEDLKKFEEIIRSTAHLIIEFSQEGGFDSASGF